MRILVLVVLITACTPDLVDWGDVVPVAHETEREREREGDGEREVKEAEKLRLVANGTHRVELVAVPAVALAAENGCSGSLVTARSGGDEWYAAWWSPRGDGSVVLLTSRSEDGGVGWSEPVPADDRDRGGRGCDRPAPGIAADSAGGYVHLVYWLEPPGEQGVWYAHSMERGALWHAPTGIIFGADPAHASVAANGDTVVVAYEHPNAAEGRIGLAVSHTAGHMIDGRTLVSVGNAYAERPLVAVLGRDVAVAWTARQGRGEAAARHLVVRRGRIRKAGAGGEGPEAHEH